MHIIQKRNILNIYIKKKSFWKCYTSSRDSDKQDDKALTV